MIKISQFFQKGMSLVELMVASSIGLITISAGTITVSQLIKYQKSMDAQTSIYDTLQNVSTQWRNVAQKSQSQNIDPLFLAAQQCTSLKTCLDNSNTCPNTIQPGSCQLYNYRKVNNQWVYGPGFTELIAGSESKPLYLSSTGEQCSEFEKCDKNKFPLELIAFFGKESGTGDESRIRLWFEVRKANGNFKENPLFSTSDLKAYCDIESQQNNNNISLFNDIHLPCRDQQRYSSCTKLINCIQGNCPTGNDAQSCIISKNDQNENINMGILVSFQNNAVKIWTQKESGSKPYYSLISPPRKYCNDKQTLFGFTENNEPMCAPSTCPPGYSVISLNNDNGNISCEKVLPECKYNSASRKYEQRLTDTLSTATGSQGQILKERSCVEALEIRGSSSPNACENDQTAMISSINKNGIVCISKPTSDCGVGKVQKGIDSQGKPICQDRGPGESANCPTGKVQRGINNEGKPICMDVIEDLTGSTEGQILCKNNELLSGLTDGAIPICVKYPATWDYHDIIPANSESSQTCPNNPHTLLCGENNLNNTCYINQNTTRFVMIDPQSDIKIQNNITVNIQVDLREEDYIERYDPRTEYYGCWRDWTCYYDDGTSYSCPYWDNYCSSQTFYDVPVWAKRIVGTGSGSATSVLDYAIYPQSSTNLIKQYFHRKMICTAPVAE